MNSNRAAMSSYTLPIIGFLVMALCWVTQAQAQAQTHMEMAGPSPSPLPSNDSATIDQGIAYILLLVALAVTYLVH